MILEFSKKISQNIEYKNEKIDLISPSGKRETVKYKKLQDYLNRGYTQA